MPWALRLLRTEDGAFNTRNPNVFYFVTTGQALLGVNAAFGRSTRYELEPANPTQRGSLTSYTTPTRSSRRGGDIAISPDNIDTNRDYIMINEDGTRPEPRR